jgi:hypothetical protein
MKIISQTRRFEVQSTFEDNKTLYVVTTRGELFPDNTQSKAITFDFKRLDGKKLTNKEEKFSDDVFNHIIKDKHGSNKL